MLGQLRPLADRAAGLARRSAGQADRLGRRIGSDAAGMVARVRNRKPAPKELDDVTLARKVESELFRPAGVPKGKVNIDVAGGIVTLRGEVKTPAESKALEAAAGAIPEVRGVENLLKLPKTPARTRADAPGRAKRTGGRKGATTADRTQKGASARFNRERPSAQAEPTPKERAAEGTGRTPAPMGSEDPSPPAS